MPPHQYIRFRLAIRADQYLQYYRGAAQRVSVTANDGRRIEFPARHLQPFLTHEGIYGEFEMELTADHRFIAIKKLS